MKKIVLTITMALTLFACSQQQPVTVTVSNPIAIDRNDEMVEVSMADIVAKLQLADTEQVVVWNESGEEVPYQITSDEMLIFPATVKASSSAVYTITVGTPKTVDVIACGRSYPERLDDLAWENDRAAYRTYGPALQASGERAFGYDVWTKNTPEPVVEERYDKELNQGISYHTDHGDGMDCYAVGATLGGGTTALFPDSTIIYPYAYKECEVLDNGPLRFTVKLTYHPLVVKTDSSIVETRIISLDKGSQLNKTVVSYAGLKEITPIVTGIVLHKENPAGYSFDASAGYIAYTDSTENPQAGNGIIYLGAVFPAHIKEAKVLLFSDSERKECGGALGHVLAVNDYAAGDDYTYYWGSGWSKYGFGVDTDWMNYLNDFAQKVRNPLVWQVK